MAKGRKSAIYRPTGRAREYAELAMNLYDGCPHGCQYCYAPALLHKTKEQFHAQAKTRLSCDEIIQSAAEWSVGGDERRNVLLCFTCDPYPRNNVFAGETMRTRQAIQILHNHGFNVTILTKGGNLARRDFDLLRPGDEFAVTLTTPPLMEAEREKWEPGAAPTMERAEAISNSFAEGTSPSGSRD